MHGKLTIQKFGKSFGMKRREHDSINMNHLVARPQQKLENELLFLTNDLNVVAVPPSHRIHCSLNF